MFLGTIKKANACRGLKEMILFQFLKFVFRLTSNVCVVRVK